MLKSVKIHMGFDFYGDGTDYKYQRDERHYRRKSNAGHSG